MNQSPWLMEESDKGSVVPIILIGFHNDQKDRRRVINSSPRIKFRRATCMESECYSSPKNV